jgi:hypothetical protein
MFPSKRLAFGALVVAAVINAETMETHGSLLLLFSSVLLKSIPSNAMLVNTFVGDIRMQDQEQMHFPIFGYLCAHYRLSTPVKKDLCPFKSRY